ncbi:hypothetical protein [Shewanella chilikensis]|uniref:hypothetical protein n=1 Tax=Shewanella TaxID=22 RepID=UPI00399A7900
MLKQFMEIKLLLTFSFAFSILIGCSKASEDSNDLAKLAHSQMSHGEAEMVVAERKEIFEQLVKACEKYPSLRSVGPEDGRERLYKTSGEPSKEFKSDLDKYREQLLSISALELKCGRRGDFENNPLVSVSIIFNVSGLSVSGEMISIVYFTDFSKKNGKFKDVELESMGYKKIENTNWYYYLTRK